MSVDREIFDYLLGRLPPERMDEIDQRILTDDDFHQQTEFAEEELIDQYARGRIAPEDRRPFEQHFLASEVRRQRLQFAIALHQKTSTPNKTPGFVRHGGVSQIYGYGLAAVAVLAIFLGVGLYRSEIRFNAEKDRTAQLQKEIDQLRSQNADPTALWRSLQPIQVADLSPGIPMGKPLRSISLPDGIRAMQFTLRLPDARATATVELLNDSGGKIIAMDNLPSQTIGGRRVVIVTLGSEHLKSGNYSLRIADGGLIYPFQIRAGS